MPTSIVDLTRVAVLAEIVLRGGNVSDPQSRLALQQQYARVNLYYPDVAAGLSCLFRPGASLDELAREGAYPNPRLSYTNIQELQQELAAAGYAARLYVTPNRQHPDHHTLTFVRGSAIVPTLDDAALDALIRAMHVVHNPYQTRRI